MRLLFFITDLEIGGTPSVVRELAVRLRSADVQPTVACLAPWGPIAGELEAAGIAVVPLGATSVLQLPAVLPRFIKLSRRFDTVFSFLMHANVVAALASRWLPGVRMIQSIQTTQPYPAWHWPLQGLAGRVTRTIVVPSNSVAASARQRSHVPVSKIVVIPNAIEIQSFAALRRPRLTSNPIRVGFVGRLDPVKRVPDLIRAVAQLPDAELHIYGDGEDRPAIEATIREEDMTARAYLHGQIPRPHEALAAIDVLVLPSDAEGMPLVPLEAMAAGVPVVATDVPGIQDVIRDGVTGLLVARRSPSAIAAAVRSLAADAALRHALTTNAIAHVAAQYDWPTILQQYRRVLGQA